MIIAAFDPGLHHIVWTVTSWCRVRDASNVNRPALTGVRQVGVLETDPKTRELGMVGAMNTISMFTISCLNFTLGDRDKTLIETQHTKDPKVRKDDIRDLAVVTGALASKLLCDDGGRPEWVPTGPGGWSNLEKPVRHCRLTDYYFKDHDLSQSALTGVLKGRKTMTKRMHGDALDTIGMSLWYMLGQPRAGI